MPLELEFTKNVHILGGCPKSPKDGRSLTRASSYETAATFREPLSSLGMTAELDSWRLLSIDIYAAFFIFSIDD